MKTDKQIEEIKRFMKLAESKIAIKEGEERERQKSYCRGLNIMFSLFNK